MLAIALLAAAILLGGDAAAEYPAYDRASFPRFQLEEGGSAVICNSSLWGGSALRSRVQSVGCFLQQTETRPGNCLTSGRSAP